MRKTILTYNSILIMLVSVFCNSQDAVHNYGNIQVHDMGMVGFHMDVINDGAFNQNLGLVGFYSTDNSLTLSGNSNPIFYDAEIAVEQFLYIDNTMGIQNHLNFISGDVATNRAASEININFLNDSFYSGDSDNTKVDGYAAISNKTTFVFPIGYENKLRPLTINSTITNDYVKSAYYYEDPNTPSIFGTSFNTDETKNEFISVSNFEFWHLEGDNPSTVTLTWNTESYVSLLAEEITALNVVGWNVLEKQWVNLGNTDVSGDMDNGTITSESFIPDEYEILTIGGNNDILESLSNNIDLDNYYMTPNGDGINDVLVIEGIETSQDNSLQIFNRYGRLVYRTDNYDNSFDGISNVNSVISRQKGLASGIYFYIVSLNDLKQKHQGYLYLSHKQ